MAVIKAFTNCISFDDLIAHGAYMTLLVRASETGLWEEVDDTDYGGEEDLGRCGRPEAKTRPFIRESQC